MDINFSPQPAPNWVDSATRGIVTGTNLGFAARDQRLQEDKARQDQEALIARQKQLEQEAKMKHFNDALNLLSMKEIPKRTKAALFDQIKPLANDAMGIDLSNVQYDDSYGDYAKQIRALNERFGNKEIDQSVYRRSISDLIAQAQDESEAKRIMDAAKFTLPEENTGNEVFVGLTPDGKAILQNPKGKEAPFRVVDLPVKGPIIDKTPSDAQAQTSGFSNRLIQANSEIDRLFNDNFDPTGKSGLTSKLPNVAQSPEMQQYLQAKRNFINAQLRRESGAAISASELRDADMQYFPVFGDSPEVVAQKERNRRLAEENLRTQSGSYGIGVDIPKPTQPLSFRSEEEAHKANLKPGTKIKINGRPAIWE